MNTKSRPLLSLLAAAACLTACDPASQTPDAGVVEGVPQTSTRSRAEFEEAERDAKLPEPEKVDNGDGTWSYALDAGFDPDVELRGKLLTWSYVEQAKFALTPTFGAKRSFVVPEHLEESAEDRLLRRRRIDARGRVWQVVDVDLERWRQATASAPAEQEPEALPASVMVPTEEEPAPGTTVTWQPHGWSHLSCVPGGGLNPNELHLWDGDNRVQVTSPTGRQKAAVQILKNDRVVCSGVILRAGEVLTAAHCVSDDNNNPVPTGTISVKRFDNGEVRDAIDIDLDSTYTGGSGSGGGTDFADDWAIIEVANWSSGFEDMDLSSASDTTLAALDRVHNLAFPQFFPVCADANGAKLTHTVEFEPIAAVQNKRLKLKIDGSPGHSGSPLYYCPDGDNNTCGGGEQGFVIGVFSGWNTADDRFVGPKASHFKDEAIALMDD